MRKGWKFCLVTVVLLVFLTAVPVLAEGSSMKDLKQTDAGAKTITLSWRRPEGAVSYEIYSSLSGRQEYERKKSIYSGSGRVTTQIKVAQKETGCYYDLQVVALDEEGKELVRGQLKRCPTIPGAPDGIRQQSLYTSRKMNITWKRQGTASGYQLETYLCSAKKRMQYFPRSTYAVLSMEQDQLYRIRIRGYVNLKVDGKTMRLYGAYTTIYTSLEPRLIFQGGDEHSVIADWIPVEGADSYAVFVSEKQKTGYRRVCVTRDATAVLNGLKPNTRYYVLVRMNKRVDGRLHRSPATYVYPVKIDTKGAAANTGTGFILEA